MKKDNTVAAIVAVTLARSHTHDGVRHPAGTTLQVPPHDAAWLKAHGIVTQDEQANTPSQG